MKKLLITSIAVVFISIVFTMGFVVMKLNNYNLFEIELPKIAFHFDKKEKKDKPKEKIEIESISVDTRGIEYNKSEKTK